MDKIDAINLYYDRPDWFAEDLCEFIPDDWQRETMLDVAKHRRVSVRSGQGVGKTSLEAILILWYLMTRPYPRIIATAPTQQQLYDVLWAEIKKWLNRSKVKNYLKWTKTKVYMRGHEGIWYATARTAARPENMQGFHEDHMLFIVDEGSGVADDIFEAIMGTLSGVENKIAVFGNPTRTTGFFYDLHNINRDLWKVRKVSSRESARTSKENIEALERKYGKESDVVRVRVDGDFPQNQSEGLISLAAMEGAIEKDIKISDARVLNIGVDVARYGEDKTVIAARLNGKVLPLYKYQKQNTMTTAGKVLEIARKLHAEYPQINRVVINVDTDGLGAGVTDRLREVVRQQDLAYKINAVHNGARARDSARYYNWISEAWDEMNIRLEENMSRLARGEEPTVSLPDDPELISELSSRNFVVNSDGKIELEKKEQMKKRIRKSPDSADAVLLSFNSKDDDVVLIGGRLY